MLAVHNSMILKEILDIRRSGHMRKIKKKVRGHGGAPHPAEKAQFPGPAT